MEILTLGSIMILVVLALANLCALVTTGKILGKLEKLEKELEEIKSKKETEEKRTITWLPLEYPEHIKN